MAFGHFMLDLEEYALPDSVTNPVWFFTGLLIPLFWPVLIQACHGKARELRLRAAKAQTILNAYPGVEPTREQRDLLARCREATTVGVLFCQQA